MLGRYYPNPLDEMAPRSLDPATGQATAPDLLEQLRPVGDALLGTLADELRKDRENDAAAAKANAAPRIDFVTIGLVGAGAVVVGLILWRALR